MSQENVEIVRDLIEAFQRRDHERAFDFYDPEIEWDSTGMEETIPDIAGVYRGHEGVRAFWRRWLSSWKDIAFEIEDLRDAGDDVVALISNQRQWGRHSGIATELPPLVFGGPLSSADITVIDAHPLPTTKDQCKRDGWKPFGFATQGLCVAFVEQAP